MCGASFFYIESWVALGACNVLPEMVVEADTKVVIKRHLNRHMEVQK